MCSRMRGSRECLILSSCRQAWVLRSPLPQCWRSLRRQRNPIRCRPGTTAPAKQAIVDFVAQGDDGRRSPDFVPPAERIATFDNDGTLWAEQPMYFQFALRARPRQGAGAAASGVEDKEPFKSLLDGRHEGAGRGGEKAMLEIIAATHAGMTTEEFDKIVADWIATAQPPALQAALHRAGLSADARAARLSARQRLQDLHRLRRRRRVHARRGPRRSTASRPSRSSAAAA